MPSPFPGMDPFLEHPDFFPDLHGALHVYIREALQRSLSAPYFAVINERLWVETTARYIEPDTDVLHGDWSIAESSAVAQMAKPTQTRPLVFELAHDQRSESFVEIRTRLADGGERATPMHLDRLRRKAGPFDYHVSAHRFDQRGRFFIYPWPLPAPLPVIGIPLLPGDDEVSLDLQAVFTRCYDTGPYRRRVVYDPARLVPALNPEKTDWLQQVLHRQPAGP